MLEAIADVYKRFKIDPSGLCCAACRWEHPGHGHLGLKHPSLFVALGPYCGYVDTHKFSETPLPNFVKSGRCRYIKTRPAHARFGRLRRQRRRGSRHCCDGEKDIFFDAMSSWAKQ